MTKYNTDQSLRRSMVCFMDCLLQSSCHAQVLNLADLYCIPHLKGVQYELQTIVCFYLEHFICYTRSGPMRGWVKYDDGVSRELKSWSDVCQDCVVGHLQPCTLVYDRQ